MTKQGAPKTTEEAAELLERYAVVANQAAAIEARRNRVIARANQVADTKALPLLAELKQLRERLRPWWDKNGKALTKGERKSIVLGGCKTGTKAARATLALEGDDFDAAALRLKALRWAKGLFRTRYSVDKAATLKALDGPHKAKLAELGFSKKDGEEEFFVEPIAQAGTVTDARR